METFRYIILGMLQGITEPIPVSSSGHLVILRRIISNNFLYDLNFEIIVNFGSLLAVLFYFRKELMCIIKDFINYIKSRQKKYEPNYRYGWLLIISTIPAALFGLLFKNVIETNLTNIKLIGFALLITATFLYLIRELKGNKDDNKITVKDAIIIGLFQVFALIPGISRSGATIVGAMFRGLKRDMAFKYSFLLFIPISVASFTVGVKDLITHNELSNLILPYTIGMITASLFTYYALGWFEQIMKKGKLIYFVYYCLIVGILVILFL